LLDKLLNLEDGQRIIDMQLLMRGSWVMLVMLLIATVLYTAFSYRSVRKVPTKGRKLMVLCQLIVLAILIAIVAMPAAKVRYTKSYRPTMLVLVDTSRSMGVQDKRATQEALEEALKILAEVPLDEEVSAQDLRDKMGLAEDKSRLELVRALFDHTDIDLLRRIGDRFDLRFFSFDRGIAPEGGADDAAAWLAARSADGEESQVGSAIKEAVSRYNGLPIAGAMVFSDFGWVKGEDPVYVAGEMERRGVPIYTIPIGLPAPPDAMIAEVIAPEVVFRGDPVTLRVRIESRGLEARQSTLSLKVNGEEQQVEPIVFEDGAQFVELKIRPEQASGTLELGFEVDGTDADSNPKNNTAMHRMRIIDEKIKVLYIEGMPRWEFRYLRWVLLRNPHLQTRFLLTEGDPDLAKMDPHYMPGFPKDVRNIFAYDLIILGDVSSKYFKPGQLELLETQIKEHGGSLIMIGGMLHAPASYQNTPVENMLPVNIGVGKPRVVANNVFPRLPADQALSPMTTLVDDPEANQRIWSKVRPLGRLPVLRGPKPSANVLLELPAQNAGEPPYPLVSWHPYGKGKAMFVGSDRLWRLRLEVGDAHHAKFWGQSIQFLAMSRLLGQNKRISLQTERKRYNPGEPVKVYANVLSETYQPVVKDSHTVVIERPGFADARQELALIPDPTTPGLYFGTFPAGEDGAYALRAQQHEAEISNTVEFTVAYDSLEDRDTTAKPELAKKIAEASGGQVVKSVDLPGFVDALPSQEMSRVVSHEIELWDTPLLYLPLVLFAGLEWYLRRRESLL
jgi:uncharacterized membrane protein